MAWTTLAVKDAGSVTRNVAVWDDGSANYTQAAALVVPVPNVLGFEKRTVSTASVGISASTIPTGATHALVTLEGDDCRFRDDGGAVTGTDGLLMIAGQAFEFTNLSALRFIRASYATVDVTLQISYRKYG
jgi:hypothetical protein